MVRDATAGGACGGGENDAAAAAARGSAAAAAAAAAVALVSAGAAGDASEWRRAEGRSESGASATTRAYAIAASRGVLYVPIGRSEPLRITLATHFLPCLYTPM